ncbi:pantetheine-phosphate adenylyltransferase [Selenomonas sp. TAMA-11512]|uniref:pantetheine-phosphate adenylyltransferase n=1 Tax=Selenomonas sp. TAMA-11512 TaxID=3095337 RepID=UPI003093D104|nr:pantetheine-phosphate adenylyltransferase [Selenomonas sp. TAMA-11512]
MIRAVCSGTFDPVTNGHIDIFERAGKIFDELIVAVFYEENNFHKNCLFTIDERLALLEETTVHIPNLRVERFSGLLTEYMKRVGARVNVRGLRSVADYEYEQKQEKMNHHIAPDIETMLLFTDPRYSFVSSSGIREMANFRGPIKGLVPPCVERAISDRINNR